MQIYNLQNIEPQQKDNSVLSRATASLWVFFNLDIASLYDRMFAMGYNKNSTDLLIPFNVQLIVFKSVKQFAYIQHRPLTSISVHYLVTSGDGGNNIRCHGDDPWSGTWNQRRAIQARECNTKCLFTPDKDLQLQRRTCRHNTDI